MECMHTRYGMQNQKLSIQSLPQKSVVQKGGRTGRFHHKLSNKQPAAHHWGASAITLCGAFLDKAVCGAEQVKTDDCAKT